MFILMGRYSLKIFSRNKLGLLVGPQSEGLFARVRHDDPNEPFRSVSLQMTNETRPHRPDYDGDGPRWPRTDDKVTVPLSTAWQEYMREIMGAFVYDEKFNIRQYGFMDTGDHKLQALSCGGNLVKVKNIIGNWAYIEHQWHEDGPNRKYTYLRYPWLNTMQVLVGMRVDKSFYYICDKRRGTLWFPIISHKGIPLAQPLEQLEFFPQLPLFTEWHGEAIVVTDYSFYGTDVYGLVNSRWRILEQMQISGHGSVLLDRVIHVNPKDWIGTAGVPNIGWRENDTRAGTGVLF